MENTLQRQLVRATDLRPSFLVTSTLLIQKKQKVSEAAHALNA